MEALLIEPSDAKSYELIAEMAKQLGSRVKAISIEEKEDLVFGEMMSEAKTGEYIGKDVILKKLRSAKWF